MTQKKYSVVQNPDGRLFGESNAKICTFPFIPASFLTVDGRQIIRNFESKMSTSDSNLCDVCQTKPKFKDHRYCGRTCASKAATLCNNCQKNPKFSGHEFCSKTCAVQARVKQQKKQQQQQDSQQLLTMFTPSTPSPGALYAPAYPVPPVPVKQTPPKGSLSSRLLHALKATPKKSTTAAGLATNDALGICIMCRQRYAANGTRFCSKECRREALRSTT